MTVELSKDKVGMENQEQFLLALIIVIVCAIIFFSLAIVQCCFFISKRRRAKAIRKLFKKGSKGSDVTNEEDCVIYLEPEPEKILDRKDLEKEKEIVEYFKKSPSAAASLDVPIQIEDILVSPSTVLGDGGTAVVFLGKFGSQNFAAVKIVKKSPSKAEQEAFNKMFKEESEIHLNLNHDSIIKMYLAGEEGGLKYSVLELCEITLDKLYFARQEVSADIGPFEAALYMHGVLKGLCYLHGNNLAHLDVKLDNIFVSSVGVAKIGDLGCAKKLPSDGGRLNCTEKEYATYIYAPPELFKKETYGVKFDAYSSGVCYLAIRRGILPVNTEIVDGVYTKVDYAKLKDSIFNTKLFNRSIARRGVEYDEAMIIGGLLEEDEEKRLSVAEALNLPNAKGKNHFQSILDNEYEKVQYEERASQFKKRDLDCVVDFAPISNLDHSFVTIDMA